MPRICGGASSRRVAGGCATAAAAAYIGAAAERPAVVAVSWETSAAEASDSVARVRMQAEDHAASATQSGTRKGRWMVTTGPAVLRERVRDRVRAGGRPGSRR